MRNRLVRRKPQLEPLPELVISSRLPEIYANLMTLLGGGSLGGLDSNLLNKKCVVLFSLVESFKFSLPEKEIVWQMNAVATPTTSDVHNKYVQLPLVVSLATVSR